MTHTLRDSSSKRHASADAPVQERVGRESDGRHSREVAQVYIFVSQYPWAHSFVPGLADTEWRARRVR
jgi:hypothetical protein